MRTIPSEARPVKWTIGDSVQGPTEIGPFWKTFDVQPAAPAPVASGRK